MFKLFMTDNLIKVNPSKDVAQAGRQPANNSRVEHVTGDLGDKIRTA